MKQGIHAMKLVIHPIKLVVRQEKNWYLCACDNILYRSNLNVFSVV